MKRLSLLLGLMPVLVIVAPSYAIKFTIEPASSSVREGGTVALNIYLDEWTEASNVAGVDYYVTYNQNAASIVSVTPNGVPANGWEDAYFYDAEPVPGSGMCGVVNYGAGVAGPKMLLQTVVLQCDDGNIDFDFVVKLDFGSILLDVLGNEYTNVTEASILIDQTPLPYTTTTIDVTTTTTTTGSECLEDADCDDEVFCNGTEVCDPVDGCRPGAPVDCPDDGQFCNGVESCDEDDDACVRSGNPCAPDEVCDEATDTCLPPRGIKAEFNGLGGSPLFALPGFVDIQGTGTNFDSFTSLEYNPGCPIFPILPRECQIIPIPWAKLVNVTAQTINQLIFVMPSILPGADPYPVTVTVTVGDDSADFEIPALGQ